MIIRDGGQSFLNRRYISALLITVFALGTLTLEALVVGAFIDCIYIVNLALTSIAEFVTTLSTLYTSSDSFVKLIMWLVLLCILWKITPFLAVRFRRAFHFV